MAERGVTALESIACLDQSVTGLPGHDLPEDLFRFISRVTPLINVDLLIKDAGGRTLLTWRDDEFYGAGWHVPGGIIRYKERWDLRIRKVADEEIGCGVTFDPQPVVLTETFREERDRGHFISMLFRCRLAGEPDPQRGAADEPKRGEWAWHRGKPKNLLPVHQVYERFFQD